MEKIYKLEDGKTPFCLFNMVRRGTLDIIALVAFNMDFDSINNDSEDSFNSMYTEANEITMRHLTDPFAEVKLKFFNY